MTREQLEHLLRAAGALTDQDRLVVIGSQAILGQFPVAPHRLCDETTLRERLRDTAPAPEIRQLVEARISGDFRSKKA